MMREPEDMDTCELVSDAAAYVLGALEESELEAYRAHLASCPSCREEVLQLQPVVDSLAVGVLPEPAPEGLRARLMAVVHAEAELLHAAGHEADRPAPTRARWRLRLAPSLATAGALVAGLLLGALAINNNGSSATQPTRTTEALVAAPGYHATATLRTSGGHVELIVKGMPAPPPGRIYEVWLETGTQAPKPTDALFSVTGAGNGSVGVPGDLKDVSKVLVTDEPLGGSLKPTRTPVIVASI